jgi:hypothetical protein
MLTLLVPLLAAFAGPTPVTAQSVPPSPLAQSAPPPSPLAQSAPPPSPLAQSAPPPSPLKEIGRVQSLSVCSAVVVHANGAIGEALDNDQQLAIAINRLRTTDLDTPNEITRRNGMRDLATLASRIRLGAAAGSGEIKRLRSIAAQTADATRKAEIKAFADALDGALARQRKAGLDLDTMLVIIDGRRAVEEVNTPELTDQRAAIAAPDVGAAVAAPGGPVNDLTQNPGLMRSPVAPPGPAPVNSILREFAADFSARTQTILSDEGVAADHALGATTGC